MKKLLLFVALAILVAGAWGVYLYQKPRASLLDHRPDFELTAEALVKGFQDNEQEANTRYLGRVVEINGPVEEIRSDTGEVVVIVGSGDPMSFVVCSMDPREWKAGKANAGESIYIKGTCTGYLMDVVLTNSVVVNK